MASIWRLTCLAGMVAACLMRLSLAEGFASENTPEADAAACSIGPDGLPLCTTVEPAAVLSHEAQHHEDHSHHDHRHGHHAHQHEAAHTHEEEHEHAHQHDHHDEPHGHDHAEEHGHTHEEGQQHEHEHEGHDHGQEGHQHEHSHDNFHDHSQEHAHEAEHVHGTEHEGHRHQHAHSHAHQHDGHDHAHADHEHEHNVDEVDGTSGLHARISEGEKHPVTAVLLTSISGFAAVVGGLIVVAMGAPSPTTMGHMLSFAAGIMLYISYADLIPHAIADMEESTQAAHVHDHSGHSHASHVHTGVGGDLEGDDPHAGHSHGSLPAFIHANAWMFAGMIFFLLVAAALPTGEDGGHGHSHGNVSSTPTARRSSKTGNQQTAQEKESSDAVAAAKRLMMTGLAAAIGISLHNLPEGLIVYNQTITGLCRTDASDPFTPPTLFATTYNSVAAAVGMDVLPENFDVSKCLTRGAAVTFAIFLHNIPEGMAVASPVYVSTGSRWQAMKYCIISAVFEPLAAIIFGLAFSSFLTRYIIAALNAMVAGIMISLCLVELLPVAASHIGPKWAALSNIVGQAVMFASLAAMRSNGVH